VRRAAIDNAPCQGTVLVGRFRVERAIGKGSTGIVLEATDMLLQQRVAVKLMTPARARDAAARQRFIREARAAFQLSSEHVTRLLDVGELGDGTPFLVMEYLVGSTLEQVLLREGRPEIDVGVDWVLQALEGVAEAHRKGFVHRDLKPENLFLCERGDQMPLVKVLDFGAVKDLGTNTRLTRTGSTMGSPAYMAPEQVRADEIDPRADVWALGVTLYEILTGHMPFFADSVMHTLAAVLRDEPVPPRVHRPSIPPELEAVVMATLSKDPAGRPASATELRAALSVVRAKMPRTTRVTKTIHLGRNLLIPRPVDNSETTEMSGISDVESTRVQRVNVTARMRSPARAPQRQASPYVLLLVVLGAAVIVGVAGGFLLTRRLPRPPTTGTATTAPSMPTHK
jgi:serine/threonine protein kinase